jgi:predicted O-methyltransferase YrrM
MTIPGIPPFDADHWQWNMDSKYRRGYIESKFEIALRHKPKRICEIGFYNGISAACFLAASPKAMYTGIDNKQDEQSQGLSILAPAWDRLLNLGYDVAILEADSQKMLRLPNPPYDFIHIDGNHHPDGAKHDVEICWPALTDDGVLVIDDCHNMDVVAGVSAALYPITDLLNWYYCDEGVGSMVIFREPRPR